MRLLEHQRPGRQNGFAVLLVMLVVFATSSLVLLKALNESSARSARTQFVNTRVLMDAKSALVGYALGYADGTKALTSGPGHLPCPDHDPTTGEAGESDDGLDCTAASGNETGLFPWHTLGVPELRDGSGAPLWYAVSDNFRAVAGAPLNSDTVATLTVDTLDEIVAVIIAPGPPTSGQSRGAANAYDAASFLENDNASTGDGSFVTTAAGEFNDTVVAISRSELMAAVERTVLTEAANALDSYFDTHDGYPWLRDFDPTTSDYSGSVGTVLGQLPLVESGVPFNADFSAQWSIATAGTITGSGSDQPDNACLRANDCTQTFMVPWLFGIEFNSFPYTFPAVVDGSGSGSWGQGSCTLTGPDAITCTVSFDFTAVALLATRDLRRVYAFTFADNATLVDPTASARRTLAIQPTAPWSGAVQSVTITDYDMPGLTEIGTRTLSFDTLDSGDSLSMTGIPFEMEVSNDFAIDHAGSPGELPNWFTANRWHEHVVVQYATAEGPGAAAATCIDDASCLTLNVTRAGATPVADTAVRGVVLAPGEWLTGVNDPRPTTALDDYLEGNNAVAGLSHDKQQATATFNDQVVTLPLVRP